jgi:hypothetical protein
VQRYLNAQAALLRSALALPGVAITPRAGLDATLHGVTLCPRLRNECGLLAGETRCLLKVLAHGPEAARREWSDEIAAAQVRGSGPEKVLDPIRYYM